MTRSSGFKVANKTAGVSAACFKPSDGTASVAINHVTVFNDSDVSDGGYYTDEYGKVIDQAAFMGGGVASLGACKSCCCHVIERWYPKKTINDWELVDRGFINQTQPILTADSFFAASVNAESIWGIGNSPILAAGEQGQVTYENHTDSSGNNALTNFWLGLFHQSDRDSFAFRSGDLTFGIGVVSSSSNSQYTVSDNGAVFQPSNITPTLGEAIGLRVIIGDSGAAMPDRVEAYLPANNQIIHTYAQPLAQPLTLGACPSVAQGSSPVDLRNICLSKHNPDGKILVCINPVKNTYQGTVINTGAPVSGNLQHLDNNFVRCD